MPYPSLLHPEPLPPWQSTADQYLHKRGSNTVLSQSLWGLWVLVHTRFVWALWVSLVGMGFDSKRDFAPHTILWGFSFALGYGVSPHSCSSACCLTGVSLTLDVGYLLGWAWLQHHVAATCCFQLIEMKSPSTQKLNTLHFMAAIYTLYNGTHSVDCVSLWNEQIYFLAIAVSLIEFFAMKHQEPELH